jgi:hypothetical protein
MLISLIKDDGLPGHILPTIRLAIASISVSAHDSGSQRFLVDFYQQFQVAHA